MTWPSLCFDITCFPLRKISVVKSLQSKGQFKAVPEHAKQAHRVGRAIDLSILNLGAGRGWVVNSTPWFYPSNDTGYPLYRDLYKVRERSGDT